MFQSFSLTRLEEGIRAEPKQITQLTNTTITITCKEKSQTRVKPD